MARLRAAGCVFAEDEAGLLAAAAAGPELEALVARRVMGEPLEHLLGSVRFAGLELSVGPGVFIPRQRTRLMARLAAELMPDGGLFVELCCGVAPVAAVVAARVLEARIWAADVDRTAAAHARRNLGPRATVLVGDLDGPLPAGLRDRVDVLAVNTPYVPTGRIVELPPEARDHEPRRALDGGADGLDVQRRLAGVAAHWLTPGGHVLVEVAAEQATASAALFTAAGLASTVHTDGELEATVVLARRPWAD